MARLAQQVQLGVESLVQQQQAQLEVE